MKRWPQSDGGWESARIRRAGDSTNAAARPNSSGSPYRRSGMCPEAGPPYRVAAQSVKFTDPCGI